jgi:hypothetical protein
MRPRTSAQRRAAGCASHLKHNRDSRGRHLGREGCWSGDRHNHAYLLPYEFGGHLRKQSVATYRPMKFDLNVLALGVAGFTQAVPKSCLRRRNGGIGTYETDYSIGVVRITCCAFAASGRVTAAPPISVMNVRRFMSPPQRRTMPLAS